MKNERTSTSENPIPEREVFTVQTESSPAPLEKLASAATSQHADARKNAFMLTGALAHRGYDWWWHSFVARSRRTGMLEPFFIEYYLTNPALGGHEPILGQKVEHKLKQRRPSYGMMKAGLWRENSSVQVHSFHGISHCSASTTEMNVRIGENTANETELKGAVSLDKAEAESHPELMSQAGALAWDLKARKILSYDVGYGASAPLRWMNAFEMFWHVQGMKTEYSGSLIYNGEEFDVIPELSFGYQDKNWGTDFTNPWIWLNCNHFVSVLTGKPLPLTSLDVGGGTPVVYGIAFRQKLIIAFYHEGQLYEFNFSKPWTGARQSFVCRETATHVVWEIEASTFNSKIEINFSCPLSHMLKINYENPDGVQNHKNLLNGGHASGTVKLYGRTLRGYQLIDVCEGKFGGCEFGQHE